MNSPWREWVFQVLRDLCAYPIDGVFFDGPIFFADTCYCGSCRRKYADLFGEDIPPKERSHPGFPNVVNFQQRSLADFLRDSLEVIRSTRDDVAFYMNGNPLAPTWPTGRSNRVLTPYQDMLGSEGGFLYDDLSKTPLWKPGAAAKLLETQATDEEGHRKPTVVFNAGAHKSWTFYPLAEAEIGNLYAQSIAHGAYAWFSFNTSAIGSPQVERMARYNKVIKDNPSRYRLTTSQAEVALLWSERTADFYSSAVPVSDFTGDTVTGSVGDVHKEFSGFYTALWRTQVPFDVIDDMALETGRLDRYKLVVLPNAACMSDEGADHLRHYVDRGGTLMASFEAGLYDAHGRLREYPALGDVLGAKPVRLLSGPRRWDFIHAEPASDASWLFEGVDCELWPSPEWALEAEGLGAKLVARFSEKLKGCYDGYPSLSGGAIWLHSFGKGVCIYLAGDFGAALSEWRLGEHLRLVENTLRHFAPSPVRLVNCPKSVEVSLRRTLEGELVVHLINYTGAEMRPLQQVVELEGVEVWLRADRSAKVEALWCGGEWSISPQDGWLIVRLERLGQYEALAYRFL